MPKGSWADRNLSSPLISFGWWYDLAASHGTACARSSCKVVLKAVACEGWQRKNRSDSNKEWIDMTIPELLTTTPKSLRLGEVVCFFCPHGAPENWSNWGTDGDNDDDEWLSWWWSWWRMMMINFIYFDYIIKSGTPKMKLCSIVTINI